MNARSRSDDLHHRWWHSFSFRYSAKAPLVDTGNPLQDPERSKKLAHVQGIYISIYMYNINEILPTFPQN